MKAIHTSQFKQLLISTVLLRALAGCGQSGPLYLPEQKAEQNKPQDVANPATQTEQTNTPKKQEQ